MDKYSNIIDKIIQNDSHFANHRNSYYTALNKTNFEFAINLYILKYKILFCVIKIINRIYSAKSSQNSLKGNPIK
jgi:hypothetical protein